MQISLSCWTLTVVVMLLIAAASQGSAAKESDGQKLYLRYCASCHGPGGKGNGPVSPYFKIKIPDLTLLKKQNRGIYPLRRVMTAIDGSRAVRGHGDRKMPVWGEIFRKEAEDAKYTQLTTLLKEKIIAEYVATLQK